MNNNFPSSFRPISEDNSLEKIKKTTLPSSFRPTSQEEIPDFFEEGFGPEFERETERHQARNLSRFLESTIGLPGDIASFATGLLGSEQKLLPRSEDLQRFSERATGGFTTPQSELERFSDDVFKDIGTMLFPGAKAYNAARNIGIPIVGNLIKEGIKYSGTEEKNASYAKMGTMIALDLLSQRRGMGGGAKKYAGNLFKKAEELVPEGVKVDATQLQQNLSKLENNLKMGGKRPSTQKSLEKISEIQGEIKDGKIGVKELMAYRPSINEAISEYGGFDLKLNPAIKQKAIRNLQDVKKSAINAIEEWGAKESPEFLKLNRSANEAWAAYENSNKIAQFIEKHAGKFASPVTKSLFGLGTVGTGISGILAPTATSIAGGAGLLGVSGYQTFKILSRIKNSKTLSKYYGDILSGAAKGNAGQVLSNLKALDKELQNQD